MSVNTVLGPIEAGELGRTLMHEHVYTLLSDLHTDYAFDDAGQDAAAIARLREVVAGGFRSIVDLTVIGLGRNIRRIIPLAQKSGIHIVAATGIYTFKDLPSHFRSGTKFVHPDYIADFLVREIDDGIGETGVRAGVIKFAVDAPGITPDLDVLIRQSAKAQLRTGAPISTHTDVDTQQGLAQQTLLRECGVDLGRVVIGHSGDSDDYGYLEALIDKGSYLGMDRFGVGDRRLDLDARIDVVAELCRRGYADRMVLSHDANVYSDNTVAEARALPEYRDWIHTTVASKVLPGLRDRGVSDTDIDTMTITNPAAILDRR